MLPSFWLLLDTSSHENGKQTRDPPPVNLLPLLPVRTDELSALKGNVIYPRARRKAAIASQRRTASEIGKFVGGAADDDDDYDSDEDGELGGNLGGASAAVADGESDEEAELEF